MGVYKPKKATFTSTGKGSSRIFTAVNKRAHTVCKKAGKRTKISASQLKEMVGKGTYKFYAYDTEGSLKPVRF